MNDSSNANINGRRQPTEPSAKGRVSTVTKIVVLLAVATLVAYVFLKYGDDFNVKSLVKYEDRAQLFRLEHPAAVYGVAFLIYVAVAGSSIPPGGATVLTLVYGWFFGLWQAMVLVSFASTAGATVAFLLSRYLFRDVIQNKFRDRLTGFNEALEREGAFYLFSLRLIPAVPFFAINLIMGLTPIRVTTYWWVSQLGMLPGTFVYVYAGHSVPTIQKLVERGTSGILTPQLFVAFVLLGLFPFVAKKLLTRFRKSETESIES